MRGPQHEPAWAAPQESSAEAAELRRDLSAALRRIHELEHGLAYALERISALENSEAGDA